MKTLDELQDTKPNPEVDDFLTAARIVNEQFCTHPPEMRMYHMAVWVARLREHYVAIGRALGEPRLD